MAVSARPGAPRRDANAGGVNLWVALQAVRRWWKLALPAALVLATAAGSVILLTFVPKYRASAYLLIRETPETLVMRVDAPRDSRFVETQKELLRSRKVLRLVLAQEDISQVPEAAKEKDKADWLAAKLDLRSVGNSELLSVSFECSKAQDAQRVVNAVVSEYLSLVESFEGGRAEYVLKALKEAQAERERDVKTRHGEYRKASMAATGRDPLSWSSEMESLASLPLGNLQMQMVNAEVERMVLEAQLKAVEADTKSAGAAVPDLAIERAIQENPELNAFESELAGVRARLQTARTAARDPENDPFCQQLSQQVAKNDAALGQLREEYRGRLKAQMQAARADEHAAEIARLRMDVERARLESEEFRKRFDEESSSKKSGSGDMADVELRRAEWVQAQQVLNLIITRITELETERNAPSRVTLYDPADLPPAPMVAFPLMPMALGVAAGLVLPFGLAIGWESLIRRISNSRVLEQETDLRVVGEIARLPSGFALARGSSSRRIEERLCEFEESIDSMRTWLMLCEDLRSMKILSVTSAASKEGKTSVAAQLAVSLARASRQNTLLVDGDTRSPDLHNIFETRQTPGLVEVLAGECLLQDAIVPSAVEHLHVLPGGHLRTNPHRLFGNGTLHDLLDRVSAAYRYVVIDTPPVLVAGEALVLSRNADATLICAMRDVSRADQVRKACDRLVAAGCRPVGAVLSGVAGNQYRYGRYDHQEVAPSPSRS